MVIYLSLLLFLFFLYFRFDTCSFLFVCLLFLTLLCVLLFPVSSFSFVFLLFFYSCLFILVCLLHLPFDPSHVWSLPPGPRWWKLEKKPSPLACLPWPQKESDQYWPSSKSKILTNSCAIRVCIGWLQKGRLRLPTFIPGTAARIRGNPSVCRAN